jgi:hypothetical protein
MIPFLQDPAHIWHVAILLVFAHCLADYPLQGDFMAQAKNRNHPVFNAHGDPKKPVYWKWVLPSHGLIHAGFVYLITGMWVLFLAEFVMHTVIDFFKCDEKISYNTDQALHLFCKVAWLIVFYSEITFKIYLAK